ncbi:hypothetical protein RHOFW510R12_03945 [Rhodanobacter sp. FW510-R12]|uniref:DUF2779 domain-containing protein n=1 Tax=Rhodanobacter TaxID=75309 RepID=UPI0003FCC27E|nr:MULTISPECIES: DUF2779 domain-containing protein [Rhodanobacter]TAN14603.1 MAG: DUF2779 domain-containing protein [Rhodanobacter sp.]UJJ55210.1 DUF2779 domain-containing protein [Rhodanobacter thiooxydans]
MPTPTVTRLSKSRIVAGLQCARRLWLGTYQRDAMETTPANQTVLNAGNDVGDLARELYGPGLLIGHVENTSKALAETAEALQNKGKRQTLFEAAFQHQDVLVRADVLKPVPGGYDLIEVKSSTSVKEYHLVDCAIQAWVIRNAGITLRRVYLAHIDTAFVYEGDDDYDGLLVAEDITAEIADLIEQVPSWVRKLQKVLRGNEPSITTGEHCSTPFDCPFFEHCRSQEPQGPKYPVTILKRSAALTRALIDEGYVDLRKVPAERLTNPIHQRIRKASATGKPFLDPAAAEQLDGLDYPRYYLDFETINHAIPRWASTRPYQQVPFQWSCQIEQRDGNLKERAFLDLSGDDPTRDFAESLLRSVGKTGPVLVYNRSFEASRVKELAEWFPDLADALLALNERMVDLLPITQKHYYHPAMMGSWSIKKVLPTIAPELDYSELDDVADGGQAQLAYLEATHPETPADRRATLDTALRRYCGQDTIAMVRLLQALAGR